MNSAQRAVLTFDWQRERWNYGLPALLAFFLIVHFLSFYIFQTVYPATTSLPPASARIAVLDPKDPAQAQLLQWIELRDPASISAPGFNQSLVSKLVPPYKPTFSRTTPQLVELSPGEVADHLPSLFGSENLLSLRTQPAVTEKRFTSSLHFSEALQSRAPESLPPLPKTSRLVEPNTVFLSVGPAGEVTYAFLWKSSGDTNLDRTAESFIRGLRFAPAKNSTWGMAELRWGVE
jgi:TonB family protein